MTVHVAIDSATGCRQAFMDLPFLTAISPARMLPSYPTNRCELWMFPHRLIRISEFTNLPRVENLA
jgi:hypothetical protein